MSNQVHIARNGQVLPPVEVSQIPGALAQGTLLPTDYYYDEATTSWIPLAEWTPPPAREIRQTERPEREPEEERQKVSRRNRGKKGTAKKQEHFSLGGWIACLFMVGVAAGLGAWAQSLNDELTVVKKEVGTLNSTIKALKQENSALNEMTPAGRVRCIVTYDPGNDQVSILSGVTVGLYKRSAVENLLQQPDITGGAFEDAVQKVKSSLPSPIAVTLSDSNGRVDLPVPEAGDYVLAASAAEDGNGRQLLWLSGFRATDLPSNVLLLSEKDAISRNRPKFEIRNMKTLSIANPE